MLCHCKMRCSTRSGTDWQNRRVQVLFWCLAKFISNVYIKVGCESLGMFGIGTDGLCTFWFCPGITLHRSQHSPLHPAPPCRSITVCHLNKIRLWIHLKWLWGAHCTLWGRSEVNDQCLEGCVQSTWDRCGPKGTQVLLFWAKLATGICNIISSRLDTVYLWYIYIYYRCYMY